jgi:hypothetical protein
MKTKFQQLAAAMIIILTTGTADARPIVLPDPANSTTETGSFIINPNNQITLTGSHVDLTTTQASSGDIASGSARFMGGTINYHDGATKVAGKMAKVTFASEVKNGTVIYIVKGLVYGKLTQTGTTVDVNGDFAVSTKPAMEGTTLDQAQVDSSHLLLTIRSNINNIQAQ